MSVLYQIPIMTENYAYFMFGGVAMILIGVLIVLGCRSDILLFIGCFLFLMGICSFFYSLYYACNCEEETGRYRYECMLNGEMSCNEIYDKYNVIERRGSIWVLEDKE